MSQPEKKTINVASDTVTEDWQKTDVYCPKDGTQNVWLQVVDKPTTTPKHICTNCKSRFLLSAIETDSEAVETRIKALDETVNVIEERK